MLTDRPFGSLVREDKPAKDLWGILDRHPKPLSFGAIRIKLASPQKIRDWSHGEVKKPETINYRTFKPERDGLFCARIFGPTKDYECACGKYKRMKFAGVICDKCGVEVTRARVRRERMGHIELASPVSHVWFFKGAARVASGSSSTCRCASSRRSSTSRSTWWSIPARCPGSRRRTCCRSTGSASCPRSTATRPSPPAWARRRSASCCAGMDMDVLARELRAGMGVETSAQKQKKIVKRLKVVEAFLKSGNQPEWMILEVLPVIPPELRPLVPLDGGRFATSDLNDLYRRVINRNNRLKRLMELRAPEIIIRNEKRMLQEAVDALFDNGRRGPGHHRAQQPPAEVAVRHPQGQAGPLPPEPARQAGRLLRPLGHRGRARTSSSTSAACPRRWRSSCSSRSSSASSRSAASRRRSRRPRSTWRRSGPRCGTSWRRSSRSTRCC